MLANSAFVRHIIILKGIDTKKDEMPFGYIKIQAIVDRIELEVVLQNVDVKDERLNLMGVIKKLDRFMPVYFTRLEKPQKMMLTQNLSTSRFNMFSSGYQLKEIVGFAISKEKKGKNRLLLVGAFEDGDIYRMEKDIEKEFESEKDDGKSDSKENMEKKKEFLVENQEEDQFNQVFDNEIAHNEKVKEIEEVVEYKENSSADKEFSNSMEVFDKNLNNEMYQTNELYQTIVERDNKEDNIMFMESEDMPEIFKADGKDESKPEPQNKEDNLNKLEIEDEDFLKKGFDVLEFGDKKVWKRIFDDLKEYGEKFKPFSDDKVKWVKIDKKDIYKLSNYHPFLYILSNPFVFNFISNEGFLIVGYRHSKKRDRIEILLPGEFSEDNMRKAKVFGFVDFATKDGKIYEGKEGYFKMSVELIEREE